MMKKPLIIGIGELLWDLLPEGRSLGGAPANFAYHAAVQGAESRIVSAVGNDGPGQDIIAKLAGKQLPTRYIAVDRKHPTGTVTVEILDDKPDYTIHGPVAWDFIPFSNELAALAVKADAVCFGTLAQRNEISAATIRKFLSHTRPDCLKIFDINLRQDFFSRELINVSLQQCNILKINDEELPVIAEFFGLSGSEEALMAELVHRYTLKYVVLTRGSEGSVLSDGHTFITVPACDSGPVVDTVGCGDSFTAALTAGLLFALTPEESMRHASKVAGLVCASRGAMPEIPPEKIYFNYIQKTI